MLASLSSFSLKFVHTVRAEGENWWNVGWEYRKLISVTNKIDDYQTNLTIYKNTGTYNCSNHCNNNFSDIRFVRYSDNSSALPYWMENHTSGTSCQIWVNNGYNESYIWLYYGNSAVSTTSNGTNTFLAWDDFDEGYGIGDTPKASRGWTTSGIDANNHLKIAVNPDGDGNVMKRTLAADAQSAYLHNENFASAQEVRVFFKFYGTSGTNLRFYTRTCEGGLSGDKMTTTDYSSDLNQNIKYYDSGYKEFNPQLDTVTSTWMQFEQRIYKSDYHLIMDGTDADGAIRTAMSAGIDSWESFGYSTVVLEQYIDNFFICNYTSGTEPSFSGFGDEQTPSGPSAPTITTNMVFGVEETNATIGGTVTNNGSADTTGWFLYGNQTPPTDNNDTQGIIANGASFTYNWQGLDPGSMHYYQAKGNNSEGWDEGEIEAFITKPNDPSGLTITPITGGFNISWTHGTGYDASVLRYDTTGYPQGYGAGNGTLLVHDDVNYYEHTGLGTGTYYYRVWESAVIVDVMTSVSDGNVSDKEDYVVPIWYSSSFGGSVEVGLTSIPQFSNPASFTNTTDVSLSPVEWNITITDNGGTFDWSIETAPNVGSNSANDDTNGSKTVEITGLVCETNYTIYVNATDNEDAFGGWHNETYWFETENCPIWYSSSFGGSVEVTESNHAPTQSGEFPTNQSTGISITPSLHVICSDSDSDVMTATWWSNSTSPNWYDADYDYRKLVTIYSENLVDETLINFPVRVHIVGDLDLESHAQPDGDDIFFVLYSDNSTKLNHETEFWDLYPGGINADIWVNVTKVSSSENTLLWMYYGNNGCSSQENVHGTWDSNFVGVWHMNHTSGDLYDSTTFGHHGTENIEPDSQMDTSGFVDGADFFGGDADYIEIGTTDDLNITGSLTLSAWINMSADGSTGRNEIATKSNWTDSQNHLGYFLWVEDAVVEFVVLNNGLDGESSLPGRAEEVEYYYTGVFNTTHTLLYENGTLASGPNVSDTATVTTTPYPLTIGCNYDYESMFNGTIDEVRLSNVARNATWIGTTYNAIKDPSSFHSIGSEQPQWAQFGTNTSVTTGTNITQTNANFSEYSTKYWWMVRVNESNGGWCNETYWFETEEGVAIDAEVNVTTWTIGTASVGTSPIKNFTFYQNGTANVDVEIGLSNSNLTFVNYTDYGGVDCFSVNFTNDSWVTEYNILTTPYNGTLKSNFAPGSLVFGLRMWMPEWLSGEAKKEDFEVILTVTEYTG